MEKKKEKNLKKKTQTLRKNVHKEGMWHQLSNYGIMEGSKLRPNFLSKTSLFIKSHFPKVQLHKAV